MNTKKPYTVFLFNALLMLAAVTSMADPLRTAFTYQGLLADGTGPANGYYDFRFRLAADALADNDVGSAHLTNGLFTVTMHFGPEIFTGSNYWLEVDVRTNEAGSYAVLTPLQALTPAPNAIFATTSSNLAARLPVSQSGGTAPLTQLPSMVVSNNANSLSLNGTFSGGAAA